MRNKRLWFTFGIILAVALMIGYPLFSIQADARGLREVEAAPAERRLAAPGERVQDLAHIISVVEALAGEVSVAAGRLPWWPGRFRRGPRRPGGSRGALAGGRGAAGGFRNQGAAGGRFAGTAGQGQRGFGGGARDADVLSGCPRRERKGPT